jgi:hypothetical protein
MRECSRHVFPRPCRGIAGYRAPEQSIPLALLFFNLGGERQLPAVRMISRMADDRKNCKLYFMGKAFVSWWQLLVLPSLF